MSCFENIFFSGTLFYLYWLKPPTAYLTKISDEENNMKNGLFISVDIVLSFLTCFFILYDYAKIFRKQALAQ
jgi:hypothetical protein